MQDYFKETYGRETHFIPNGVNRPQIREASLIIDKFGLKKDSYILFLGRLVPEKGIRYLVEALSAAKKKPTARPMRPSPKTGCGNVCSAVPPIRWTSYPLTGLEIAGSCQ